MAGQRERVILTAKNIRILTKAAALLFTGSHVTRSMLVAIAVILLGGCGRTERSTQALDAPGTAGPELTVRAGEPWKYGKLLGRYFVAVRDHTGRTTWTCEVTSPERARLCERTRDWLTGPGTYTLAAVLQKDAVRVDVATQVFEVDGSELGIDVDLAFMSDTIEVPLRLAELHVMRLLPSIPGVSLEQAWTPSASSHPAYRLVNESPRELYGVGWFGNYFGHVEQRVGSSWTRLPQRGGFCGTTDFGKPLVPGHTAASVEGYFIGNPRAFAPGDYRYVLTYSTVSPQTGGVPTDIYESGRTYTHSSELRVIAASFKIPRSQAAGPKPGVRRPHPHL